MTFPSVTKSTTRHDEAYSPKITTVWQLDFVLYIITACFPFSMMMASRANVSNLGAAWYTIVKDEI